MSKAEENLAQVGSSLHALWKLLRYAKEDLKALNGQELDRVYLMTWRADGHLEQLTTQLNEFKNALDSRRGSDAESIDSMIDRIKAQFPWRKK